MAKFRAAIRADGDKITSRLGHREIQVTAQSQIADLRISLWPGPTADVHCSIVIFDRAQDNYPSVLYNGPLSTLVNTPHTLLEHMMFEHAQKMLVGEAA